MPKEGRRTSHKKGKRREKRDAPPLPKLISFPSCVDCAGNATIGETQYKPTTPDPVVIAPINFEGRSFKQKSTIQENHNEPIISGIITFPSCCTPGEGATAGNTNHRSFKDDLQALNTMKYSENFSGMSNENGKNTSSPPNMIEFPSFCKPGANATVDESLYSRSKTFKREKKKKKRKASAAKKARSILKGKKNILDLECTPGSNTKMVEETKKETNKDQRARFSSTLTIHNYEAEQSHHAADSCSDDENDQVSGSEKVSTTECPCSPIFWFHDEKVTDAGMKEMEKRLKVSSVVNDLEKMETAERVKLSSVMSELGKMFDEDSFLDESVDSDLAGSPGEGNYTAEGTENACGGSEKYELSVAMNSLGELYEEDLTDENSEMSISRRLPEHSHSLRLYEGNIGDKKKKTFIDKAEADDQLARGIKSTFKRKNANEKLDSASISDVLRVKQNIKHFQNDDDQSLLEDDSIDDYVLPVTYSIDMEEATHFVAATKTFSDIDTAELDSEESEEESFLIHTLCDGEHHEDSILSQNSEDESFSLSNRVNRENSILFNNEEETRSLSCGEDGVDNLLNDENKSVSNADDISDAECFLSSNEGPLSMTSNSGEKKCLLSKNEEDSGYSLETCKKLGRLLSDNENKLRQALKVEEEPRKILPGKEGKHSFTGKDNKEVGVTSSNKERMSSGNSVYMGSVLTSDNEELSLNDTVVRMEGVPKINGQQKLSMPSDEDGTKPYSHGVEHCPSSNEITLSLISEIIEDVVSSLPSSKDNSTRNEDGGLSDIEKVLCLNSVKVEEKNALLDEEATPSFKLHVNEVQPLVSGNEQDISLKLACNEEEKRNNVKSDFNETETLVSCNEGGARLKNSNEKKKETISNDGRFLHNHSSGEKEKGKLVKDNNDLLVYDHFTSDADGGEITTFTSLKTTHIPLDQIHNNEDCLAPCCNDIDSSEDSHNLVSDGGSNECTGISDGAIETEVGRGKDQIASFLLRGNKFISDMTKKKMKNNVFSPQSSTTMITKVSFKKDTFVMSNNSITTFDDFLSHCSTVSSQYLLPAKDFETKKGTDIVKEDEGIHCFESKMKSDGRPFIISNDISEEHILTSLNEQSISILSKTDANEISPLPKRKMNCNEKPSSHPSASLSLCSDRTSVCDAENSEHDDLIGLDEKKIQLVKLKEKKTTFEDECRRNESEERCNRLLATVNEKESEVRKGNGEFEKTTLDSQPMLFDIPPSKSTKTRHKSSSPVSVTTFSDSISSKGYDHGAEVRIPEDNAKNCAKLIVSENIESKNENVELVSSETAQQGRKSLYDELSLLKQSIKASRSRLHSSHFNLRGYSYQKSTN